MSDEPSQYERDTRALIEKVEARLDKHLEDIWEKLQQIEDRLINRLPVWATLIISILTALVGILAGIAFKR